MRRRSISGGAIIAYHLLAIPYVSLLKSRAQKVGVAIHQTRAVATERDVHPVDPVDHARRRGSDPR